MSIDQLRLHLAGDRYISQGLYLSLLRELEGIELRPLDCDGRAVSAADGKPLLMRLDAEQVKPVGFAKEHALMPSAALKFQWVSPFAGVFLLS